MYTFKETKRLFAQDDKDNRKIIPNKNVKTISNILTEWIYYNFFF